MAQALNGNIVLSFSETVQAGSGNIVISNGTDTRTIAVGDAGQVSFSGTGVTMDPSTDLQYSGSNYTVQLAVGVTKDSSRNAYAGIADATTLNFITGAPLEVNAVKGNTGFRVYG